MTARACVLGLALALGGLCAPSGRAAPVPQVEVHVAQLWPDRAAGAVDGRLVGLPGMPVSLAHPYGVAVADSGEVVRGRTYLSFPLHVLPVGTDVIRATLHLHADVATAPGEAHLGVYQVVASWDGLVPSGLDFWPKLIESPIATSRVRVSGPSLGSFGASGRSLFYGHFGPAGTQVALLESPAGRLGIAGRAPGLSVPAAQQETGLKIDPEETSVAIGDVVQVSVRVDGASGLRRAEFVIEYDPQILEVVDSDPDADGVQVELGPFLNANGAERNWVAPEDGVIEVAQEAGGAPVSGSGVIALITFQGRRAGTSQLVFADVLLEDQDGYEQSWGDRPSRILVGGGSPADSTPSPTPSATATRTPMATPSPTPISGADPSTTPPASPLPTPEPWELEGRAVAVKPIAGTWISWDVTALFRAWLADGADNYGLAIAPAPQPGADPEVAGDLLLARWASAEDPETAPYIIVEFQVLPVTPTPTATPPPLLPPAGRADPVRLGGLVALALVGLALLGVGVGSMRRHR